MFFRFDHIWTNIELYFFSVSTSSNVSHLFSQLEHSRFPLVSCWKETQKIYLAISHLPVWYSGQHISMMAVLGFFGFQDLTDMINSYFLEAAVLRCFCEIHVLKICRKFTGEDPCRSMVLIKLWSNFIKIALWEGSSPVNLLHIFRTPFLKNTSGRLLLIFEEMFSEERFIRLQHLLPQIFSKTYKENAFYKEEVIAISRSILKTKLMSNWHSLTFFYSYLKPFQPSVAFHLETSHLFCSAKRMIGFYMKHSLLFIRTSKIRP